MLCNSVIVIFASGKFLFWFGCCFAEQKKIATLSSNPQWGFLIVYANVFTFPVELTVRKCFANVQCYLSHAFDYLFFLLLSFGLLLLLLLRSELFMAIAIYFFRFISYNYIMFFYHSWNGIILVSTDFDLIHSILLSASDWVSEWVIFSSCHQQFPSSSSIWFALFSDIILMLDELQENSWAFFTKTNTF